MQRILVLCEGNICRSPMAQTVLASALHDLSVQSAGLGALVGAPADAMATALMRERGLDLSEHRAVQVQSVMCGQADLVLVMEQEQRARLEAMYPQVRGRVFRLAHHLGQDIPDPYRQGEAAFRHALGLIDLGVAEWLPRIRKL